MEYYNNKFPPVPVPTKRLKRKFVELDDAGDDDEVERKGQFYELLFDIHGVDIDDNDLAFWSRHIIDEIILYVYAFKKH